MQLTVHDKVTFIELSNSFPQEEEIESISKSTGLLVEAIQRIIV